MESLYMPGREAWLFSLKSFAAALLALFIAMAAGLERPYWAMATVYITANPLTGATRSKALYRFVGTVVGAIAAIVMVPNLANAPELLTAAFAAWVGLCLYLSLLDRTPRSYAFLLSGYSAAIIGFPVVDAPGTIWDVSVARVEEIGLGIACATLVGTLVLPRPVAPVLRARIVAWRGNLRALALEALTVDRPADGAPDLEVGRTRVRLAADAVEIRTLTSQIVYDTSDLNRGAALLVAMEQRLLILLPVLAAVRDRVADLRAAGGMTPKLRALIGRLHDWIEADLDQKPPVGVAALRQEIAALEADSAGGRDWPCMLRGVLLSRCAEMVDLRQDFIDLRHAILAPGGPAGMPVLAVRLPAAPIFHRDHGLALLRGGTAALLLGVTCLIWIETAWPEGAQAATLAAVACAFTAAQDDPVPALLGLMVSVILAALATAVEQFAVLPLATNFEMLALGLAAFFVPAGLLSTIPATQKLGALPIFTATLIALQGSYAADFASWANGCLAGVLGVAFAAVGSAIIVPAAASLALHRRVRAGWRELAAAARGREPAERLRLAELFMDRMGLSAPLLAASLPGDQAVPLSMMQDLRVGINLVDLNALHDAADMPGALRLAIEAVLRAAAAHFAERAARDLALPPPERLLRLVDQALDAAGLAATQACSGSVRPLVGLRRALFPEAPPYLAAQAEMEAAS